MTMTRNDHDGPMTDRAGDAELTAFFEAARAARPQPSPDLMARVLSDAQAALRGTAGPEASRRARPSRRRSRLSWLRTRGRQAIAALGGWGGLGGLSAAALSGLWIGFAAPAPVATVMAEVMAGVAGTLPVPDGGVDDTDILAADMLPDFDDFLTEG